MSDPQKPFTPRFKCSHEEHVKRIATMLKEGFHDKTKWVSGSHTRYAELEDADQELKIQKCTQKPKTSINSKCLKALQLAYSALVAVMNLNADKGFLGVPLIQQCNMAIFELEEQLVQPKSCIHCQMLQLEHHPNGECATGLGIAGNRYTPATMSNPPKET